MSKIKSVKAFKFYEIVLGLTIIIMCALLVGLFIFL